MITLDRVASLGSKVARMTQSEIARAAGCSRQRIHQLLPRLSDMGLRPVKASEKPPSLEKFISHMMPWLVDRSLYFWLMVDIQGPDDCWMWTGCKYPTGYGHIKACGGYAHRKAWELTNGPIPQGRVICHHCDNPPCCNPNHLFVGTHKDNTRDAISKGRFTPSEYWFRRNAPTYVKIIRDAWPNRVRGDGKKLAAQLGLNVNTVYGIGNNKRWTRQSCQIAS